MIIGQSVSGCTCSMHEIWSFYRRQPPPQVMICIKTFSNSLQPSNIWYQTWRSKGQHAWSMVQISSGSQTIMSDDNTTCVEARLSPSTQFQLGRDSVVKQVAECLLQLQSSGMRRRAHSWPDRCEFRRNSLPPSSGLNVMRRTEMILIGQLKRRSGLEWTGRELW